MSNASHGTSVPSKKSSGWMTWTIVGIVVLMIPLLVRSCSSGPETAPASTNPPANTQPVLTRTGNDPAYLDPPKLPLPVKPAPAGIAMNMCAAFSVVHQICPVKPFEHGTGYIAIGDGIPEGTFTCFYPRLPDLSEAWALVSDGPPVQLHDDGKWPKHVVGLELNPKSATNLIYWVQPAPCDPKHPTSS